MTRYVIGIDGGTESLRAHVFDLAGRDIGGAASAYPTAYPAPGRAEQDPREWWRALGDAVRGAVRKAGIDAGDVAALAIDTTSATVVVADAAWVPLRLVVTPTQVSVYANGGTEPDLVVQRLGDVKAGPVALWVGNGSRGDFSNLKVTAATSPSR